MKHSKSNAPKTDHAAAMPKWQDLLVQAVNEPGTISAAYSAFHKYSFGNMLLAYFQCKGREIALGPIATFKGWQGKNRQVRKGEKAIVLCQPIPFEKKEQDDKTGDETTRRGVFFKYAARWFVLAQTDGEDASALPALPEWDANRAMAALGIVQVPFAHVDGNTQGYARQNELAINPLAVMPQKTAAHEMGHIVLGHTKEGTSEDAGATPRNIREVEAESVALIVIESLGMPGAEYARGYIQHWIGAGKLIPEDSAKRIFAAADRILKAGRPVKDEADSEAGE